MKKNLFRALALVLTLALFCPLFLTGCSGKKAAVSYKGEDVSQGVFSYLCSMKKTDYLYEAYGVTSDQISSSQLQDNAMIWSAKAEDGSTIGDTLKAEVLDAVMLMLYLQNYAAEQGYSLDKEQKNMIKNKFNQMVAEYGSVKLFNKEMASYGIDYDQMLAYNYLQAMSYYGNELLFGENGKYVISEETAKQYFEDNYITVGCIFINTKNKTYPNGKVVALPDNEKAEKQALAEEVYEKVLAGEDFASLALSFSDQKITEEDAKDGYTFAKGGFVSGKPEEKAFALKQGEIARVETDSGVYILKKMARNDAYFKSVSASIISDLEELKKLSLVTAEKFELDEDFFNSLDIANIPHVV